MGVISSTRVTADDGSVCGGVIEVLSGSGGVSVLWGRLDALSAP